MQGASPQFADQTVLRATPAPAARIPFLAADVGGTHARIGLVRQGIDGERLGITQYRKFICADYTDLHDILREFMRTVDGPVAKQACIACAGLLLGDHLVNANLPWRVSLKRLRDELGLEHVVLVNDFTAVAYASHFQNIDDSSRISGSDAVDPALPRLVVGPGTGLGAAALLPGGKHPGILATEGGHAALAARTELELEILHRLGGREAHVPNERIFSGPGLLGLYRTLCDMRGAPVQCESPAQVTAAALERSDALAAEAVEVFCAWFGSLIGDLVMMLGTYGGVYLAGGVLPQIAPLLRTSAFAARLCDKGPLKEVLERVPVHLIEHGQLGVVGAAHWFLDHEHEAEQKKR